MFKYAPSKYNQLLLQMGCLRIGTLRDFRRSEHKQGIADPKEGTKHVRHEIRKLHINDSNDPNLVSNMDYRSLSTFRAFNIVNCKNVTFENVTVAQDIESPDYFIYCLSGKKSTMLFKEFEGSDSIVEIVDPHGFFRSVTLSLNSIYPVRFVGVHAVTYTDRQEHWNGVDWGTNPALIKEPQFVRQSELRAIWAPFGTGEIAPTVIGNHLVPQFCKQVG